jgi:hypothetical protein
MEKISIHEPGPDDGQKSEREIDVQSKWPIRNLGTEDKFSIKADLTRGERQRRVRFIERHYDEADKAHAEKYVENWKLLKEAGLPVPSVLRKTQGRNLLVSDVTVGDKKVYGKAFNLFLHIKPRVAKESLTPEQIEVYKKVIDEHIVEIEAQAKKLTELAIRKGVMLPTDDPFELVVSPEGNWKIMILDLMYARKIDELKKEQDVRFNERNADLFIIYLKAIRQGLES